MHQIFSICNGKILAKSGQLLCKLQVLLCSLEEETGSYFSLVSAWIHYKIKPVIGSNIPKGQNFFCTGFPADCRTIVEYCGETRSSQLFQFIIQKIRKITHCGTWGTKRKINMVVNEGMAKLKLRLKNKYWEQLDRDFHFLRV